jgi:hypothetical protein
MKKKLKKTKQTPQTQNPKEPWLPQPPLRLAEKWGDDHTPASVPLSGDAAAAVRQCDTILELIENLDESALDKASDFFESVESCVQSMRETIRRTGTATEKQLNALDNWESGVNKWVR